MNLRDSFTFSGRLSPWLCFCLSLSLLVIVPFSAPSGETSLTALPKTGRPFAPGESLVYNVSWSNILNAGTATMEVRKEKSATGDEVVRFVSTARSIGMLDKFYRVRDTIQSVFDLTARESLSYSMDQSHGKRKKKREFVFDQTRHKVTVREDGEEAIYDVPKHIQDALSALYCLRMSDELVPGKIVTIDVHDSGKNWAVDIYILKKEKIKTPAGEFATVKVKTYPKYAGVFMNKGEIFIWLTDDDHRVPVLMQSTITIGSIMATLTGMKLGGGGE